LQLRSQDGWVHSENLASIAVLKKIGFQRDTEAEKKIDPEGDERHLHIYACTAEYWQSMVAHG